MLLMFAVNPKTNNNSKTKIFEPPVLQFGTGFLFLCSIV